MAPHAAPSKKELMSPKKILVVDDNPVIVRTIGMKLKSKGYEVLTALDGAAASSTVRTNKPDLILLDISFPPDPANVSGVAWDGFLIIDWIRRIEGVQNIPIIIITGGDPKIYKERSMAAGAIAFFHKPINNDELLDVIQKTLGEPAENKS